MLRHYCQDLVEELVQSFIDASSDEQFDQGPRKSEKSSEAKTPPTRQLEIIYQLLGRFADNQKAAKRASKRHRIHHYLNESDRDAVWHSSLKPIN